MGEALIYGAGWQLFGLAGYQELLRELVFGAFPWPETLSMARFTQEMDDLGLLAALICASRTRSFLCTGISRLWRCCNASPQPCWAIATASNGA